MRANENSRANAPRQPEDADEARELETLRTTCWRQAQEIHTLQDTVAVLRSGANRLAADNAIMSAELAVSRRPQIPR